MILTTKTILFTKRKLFAGEEGRSGGVEEQCLKGHLTPFCPSAAI